MRRRNFIALLGGAAVGFPLTTWAWQPGKVPAIGFLWPSATGALAVPFVERLGELGWVDGRTIAIEYRYSEGRPEGVTEIAAEFVWQEVDVIVTYGGAVAILKEATHTIPIVFAIAGDPVGTGFVASLSRPGGNITGTSVQQAEIAGKRLELLRDVVPHLQRLAIMFDAGYRASVLESNEAQAVARTHGFEVVPQAIRRAEDIAPAFDALRGQADALYIVENGLIFANVNAIATLAIDARLPTILSSQATIKAGGLMCYGPNIPALLRRAAEITDKILRGTKPGDIPVEQPTKFDLVINLKTAKALGIDVPNSMQLLADELIE
jgi:putative ABC transport system substrate-binding protein